MREKIKVLFELAIGELEKYSKAIFFGLLAFAVVYKHDNYWRSVWWDKWFFIMAACSVYYALHLSKKIHWSVGNFVLTLLLSSLYVFGWRHSYDSLMPFMSSLDLVSLLAIGKVTSYSFSAVLLLTVTFLLFTKRDFKWCEELFALTGLLNAGFIIYEAIDGRPPQARGGFFGNSSMSGCLIAMTYPFLVLREKDPFLDSHLFIYFVKRTIYIFVPIVGIILSASSQPFGVFFVMLSSWYIAKKWKACKTRYAFFHSLAPVLVLAVVCVGMLWAISHNWSGVHLEGENGSDIFGGSGRFETWKLILTWWSEHGRHLLGQGNGITQVLVPIMQRLTLGLNPTAYTIDYWLWLHSDWLQLLFETGILGFLSGITMYGYALVKSFKKSAYLFSLVMATGSMAVFNFPAHFPFHAFIATCVLAMAFREDV